MVLICKTLNLLTQECFVPSLVEIGSVVLEKKFTERQMDRQTHRQTDGQTTDDRRSEKAALEVEQCIEQFLEHTRLINPKIYTFNLLWIHHCSWGINVCGFRGLTEFTSP